MATKDDINGIFPEMIKNFRPEKANGINATIAFDLSGENGGQYWVKIEEGTVTHGEGATDAPNMTLKATAEDFFDIATGNSAPMQAFMMGKIKVDDMNLGMKMIGMFGLA